MDSEPGRGSWFHFTAVFGLQQRPQPRRMLRAEELQGLRVLVVDDNSSAREILASLCSSFGVVVETALDGQEAIRRVQQADAQRQPFDLLLIDWKMPVLDGLDTTRAREDLGLSRRPGVIMVTAFGRESALEHAEQRGISLQGVLNKPTTASSLLQAIGEVVGRAVVAELRERPDNATASDGAPQLQGSRLLLVEDNDLNVELAVELLRNAGAEVVVAGNGREALERLAQDRRFNAVLMDCQMPVMDGYAATRAIRSDPALDGLPVIAMTANAMAGDRDKVLAAGMVDHIAKPLDVPRMLATIARWVKPVPAADPGPLDRAAGLAGCNGNLTLYQRLLERFRQGQADFAARFREALAGSDPEAPRRLAHTLKGLAGTIGAHALQQAAAALEQSCVEPIDRAQLERSLAGVEDRLAPLLLLLARAAAAPPIPAEQPADVQRAPSLSAPPGLTASQALCQLLQAVQQSDTAASDQLSLLLARVESGATPAAWRPQLELARQALDRYDFETTLSLLAPLQQQHGTPTPDSAAFGERPPGVAG